MREVGLRAPQPFDDLDAFLTVDEHGDFEADRHERDLRVWSERSLAGESVAGPRVVDRPTGLSSRRLELVRRSLHLAGEGAELIRVESCHHYVDSERSAEGRPELSLLAVLGGERDCLD